jgi:hypothetical protein
MPQKTSIKSSRHEQRRERRQSDFQAATNAFKGTPDIAGHLFENPPSRSPLIGLAWATDVVQSAKRYPSTVEKNDG